MIFSCWFKGFSRKSKVLFSRKVDLIITQSAIYIYNPAWSFCFLFDQLIDYAFPVFQSPIQKREKPWQNNFLFVLQSLFCQLRSIRCSIKVFLCNQVWSCSDKIDFKKRILNFWALSVSTISQLLCPFLP